MQVELNQTPFSRRGSYFALSEVRNRPPVSDGFYLRTVGGGAKVKEIFSVSCVDGDGGIVQTNHTATPERLSMKSVSGEGIDACIDHLDRVLFQGQGISLAFTAVLPSDYDLIVEAGENRWRYISYGTDINLMLTPIEGRINVDHEWTGVKDRHLTITMSPDEVSGRLLLAVEEFGTSYVPQPFLESFDDVAASAGDDFASWLDTYARVAPKLADTRELAAYVNWASIVRPRGAVLRQSMFMSKNWMTNVWAWDHCFNAMALVGSPRDAMDQFMTLFDHQDAYGGVPDSFNDSFVSRNFTKPAVHGWALGWMMRRAEFEVVELEAAYTALSAWNEWWFTFRNPTSDGFPHYNHGNDSGWDNSTAFRKFVPVQSPDQMSFLILQMEVLSELAEQLGRTEDALAWADRSATLLERFVEHFWVEGHFVARHALTGEIVTCDSLLMYMPLVLGERLPREIFDTLASGLETNSLLTEFGLATEATTSGFYESDGYWRGPIWAPPTMLVVDGLARGGRADLAGDIARRFCSLVERSGMAENFNAVTGEGLRDRAYTWTASVFLVLASEYADL